MLSIQIASCDCMHATGLHGVTVNPPARVAVKWRLALSNALGELRQTVALYWLNKKRGAVVPNRVLLKLKVTENMGLVVCCIVWSGQV